MDAHLIQCAYCGGESPGSRYCCQGCEGMHAAIAPFNEHLSRFTYLDLPNIRSRFQLSSPTFDYRLYIEGLHCASCVHLIERLPEFDTSVERARVDFSASSLMVKVRENFSLSRLTTLLNSWGYKAHFLAVDETARTRIQEENNALLKRLAVTGACAGNIMLFVVPVYSGLEGSWKTIFHWMSFILFLPVVLYSGIPFYQGAWNSLRYQVINVDLPIAIALLSGFLLSTVNLVRGNVAIYYDSTAGFIFLILCARYYLKRSQQKFSHSQPLGHALLNEQYAASTGHQEKTALAEDLQVNDRLHLRPGQVSPVDGVLKSPALMDLAVLNGEPLPRHFESGMHVPAGSKLLSSVADLIVTRPYRETDLARLLQDLNEKNLQKSTFVSLADKAAQWLILTVSGAAAIFFLLNFESNFQEAFNRSLALIILACPCALAFGAPLTLNLALRKAQALGILIRESGTLEKLWNVTNLVFDKTGTLTSLNLKIVRTDPAILSSEVKSIILGLERTSHHPIAFSVRESWNDHSPAPTQNVEEKIGVGVIGTINGLQYELTQNSDDSNTEHLSATLYKSGSKVCSIFFEAPLDPNAQAAVLEFQSDGMNCYLASGDRPARAAQIGKKCGISEGNVFGGLTPVGKRDFVRSLSDSCMVGDGSNDALALKEASVGIAVKGSTFANLQAADVYFTREGLKPLLDLFSLARQTKKVLVRNLAFALFYNVIGGTLALLGHVDPWLAAVLMPASSALIVSSTLWGFK